MSLAVPSARPFSFDPEPELLLERVTVEQFNAMIDAGIFYEDATLELIDGLIVRNESNRGEGLIKQRHFYATTKLLMLSRSLATDVGWLQVRLPIAISAYDEPIPDGAIIRPPPERYAGQMPKPADVAVVIEVANATLRSDRERKLKLYAAAGIPQYAIVNLVDDVVEIYETPDVAAGTYAASTIVPRDGTVTFKLFDGQTLAVPAAELLA